MTIREKKRNEHCQGDQVGLVILLSGDRDSSNPWSNIAGRCYYHSVCVIRRSTNDRERTR